MTDGETRTTGLQGVARGEMANGSIIPERIRMTLVEYQ